MPTTANGHVDSVSVDSAGQCCNGTRGPPYCRRILSTQSKRQPALNSRCFKRNMQNPRGKGFSFLKYPATIRSVFHVWLKQTGWSWQVSTLRRRIPNIARNRTQQPHTNPRLLKTTIDGTTAPTLQTCVVCKPTQAQARQNMRTEDGEYSESWGHCWISGTALAGRAPKWSALILLIEIEHVTRVTLVGMLDRIHRDLVFLPHLISAVLHHYQDLPKSGAEQQSGFGVVPVCRGCHDDAGCQCRRSNTTHPPAALQHREHRKRIPQHTLHRLRMKRVLYDKIGFVRLAEVVPKVQGNER